MNTTTPAEVVKTVANPQKELVKLTNKFNGNGKFNAIEFARLIKQCLTFVTDESKISVSLINPDGVKQKLNVVVEGLSKLRQQINHYTAPEPKEWKFIFKSDKIEATYHFIGGKFSSKLDKLVKDAISYGVRNDEFHKATTKGSNVLASDEFLGITDIYQKYKENFAPTATLSNLLPLFIAIDCLNKNQFARVYVELSKLINDEMVFNPVIETRDNINQISFSDEA